MRMDQRPRQAPLVVQVGEVFFDILARKDFDSAELFSSVLKVAWGVWLLAPWPTFDNAPAFAVMRSLFAWQPWLDPEACWGLLMVALGLNHIHALATRQLGTRRWAALVGVGIWAAVAGLVFAGNPSGTGVVVYGGLALANAWAYWRLGRRLAGW